MDEDDGRGEHDLEARIVLVLPNVVEVGVLSSLPIVDQRLRDVVPEGFGFNGREFVRTPVVAQTQEYDSLWPTYINNRSSCIMRVTGTHNDTAMLASDSGSICSFTPVYVAPFGNGRSDNSCLALRR